MIVIVAAPRRLLSFQITTWSIKLDAFVMSRHWYCFKNRCGQYQYQYRPGTGTGTGGTGVPVFFKSNRIL